MEPDERQENLLLSRASAGHAASFEKLITEYETLIYNIAYRIMGNYDDAMDISQEAIIKIYKNLSGCKDIVHFRRFIHVVVNNTCIDELRKRKNRQTLPIDRELATEDGSVKSQFKSEEKTPEQILMQKELASDLQRSILELSPEHRSIIVLRDIRGLSYKEISEITRCNLGTIKSRLARARLNLRNIFTEMTEHNNKKNVIQLDYEENEKGGVRNDSQI